MTSDPVILICAAGGSARMGPGRDKLLETVADMPLLRLVALRALATGLRVLVTLPPDRPTRRDALRGLNVTVVMVPDASTGMAASFRAGVNAAPNAPALMTMLGDMPDLETADLMAVITAWRALDGQRPVRATSQDGTPGQPVIFPHALFPALATLSGDTGGRSVLREGKPVLVPLPGNRATTDLDTPEDWTNWRAARS